MNPTNILFVLLAVSAVYTHGTPMKTTFGSNAPEVRVRGRNLGESNTNQTKVTKILFQNTHKMGSWLSRQYKVKYFNSNSRFSWATSSEWRKDASHTVITTREFFDATVSGYLYHRSGHECWLNDWGKVNPSPRGGNDQFRRFNWQKLISQVPTQNLTYPEFNLCQVLAITNETIGMGIYLEVARQKYYQILPELKANTTDDMLWVCFEDMKNDPEGTARRIRDHFGMSPKRHKTMRRRNLNAHSTDPDPVLRKRLYSIARDLDCKYFGCETQKWNDMFGCKSSIQPEEENDIQPDEEKKFQPEEEIDIPSDEDNGNENKNFTLNQRVEKEIVQSECNGLALVEVQGFFSGIIIGSIIVFRYMSRSRARVES